MIVNRHGVPNKVRTCFHDFRCICSHLFGNALGCQEAAPIADIFNAGSCEFADND
jgi:hypothetical protein